MDFFKTAAKTLLALGLFALPSLAPAAGEHLFETTAEVRTVLYFHIPDALLKARLPPGWEPVDFEAGPAKGANVTLNLSEALTTIEADGRPAPGARGRGVTLSARVKDPVTGAPRAMVLFGLTNGADTPGPYGAHLPATIGLTRREGDDGAATIVSEAWDARDTAGDGVTVSLEFARGAMVASRRDQQTRSALHPAFYRIYKMDLVSDVARSKALGLDHVRRLTFDAKGEPAKILGGSPDPIAITSVPIYRRAIWLPDVEPAAGR